MSTPGPQPVVELSGITVDFPGVRTLDDVDFRLFPGELYMFQSLVGNGRPL
jgi:simple sugar transport system ATP-binding protein